MTMLENEPVRPPMTAKDRERLLVTLVRGGAPLAEACSLAGVDFDRVARVLRRPSRSALGRDVAEARAYAEASDQLAIAQEAKRGNWRAAKARREARVNDERDLALVRLREMSAG